MVIANTSVNNNIAMSVSYIISNCRDLFKKVHYTINIITTEAKLFAIRYDISQAC